MASNTVHFNLDTATRDEEFEPFVAVVKDRKLTISDPAEVDYQHLLGIENPLEFLRFCMSQEDRDFLADQHFESWRLGMLLEMFLKHYKASERVDTAGLDRKKLGF